MTRYVARRLLMLVPVLVGVTLVSFLLIHVIPGDPAAELAGTNATPQEIEAVRERLGLNLPLHVQYWRYLASVLRGDLGNSFHSRASVSSEILARFPATLELTTAALVIASVLGIAIGVASAVRRHTALDYFGTTFAMVGISVPIFWVGLLLILFFSVYLGWFPASGRGGPAWELPNLRYVVLPAVTLALVSVAMIARLTRSAVLDVVHQDYMTTARAKGLPERWVIFRHALKNALLPVVTFVGLEYGVLLGGAVVTESVFAWPGLGRFVLQAVSTRDYPVIQGATLIFATLFVALNLVVDIAYAFLDPRIRYADPGR